MVDLLRPPYRSRSSSTALLLLHTMCDFALLFLHPAYCSHLHGLATAAADDLSSPMLFIFGASMVDTGENAIAMPLRSNAELNPYGSDYFGKPVGRWSNGRTFMDFITEGLGYGHIPPYLQSLGSDFSHGVNFASSGSTASNSTVTGDASSSGLFCLLVQVDQFQKFQAYFDLTRTQHAKEKVATVRQQFSDAIYFFETAHNDYIQAKSRSDFDLTSTISATIASMKAAFEALYGSGARTFVVMNLSPLGCSPLFLSVAEADGATLDENNCVAMWMEIVNAHNKRLNLLLSELRTLYPAAQWILFDAYSVFLDGYLNPSKYGIKYPSQACCGAGGTYNINLNVQCGMNGKYINDTYVEWTKCEDPKLYLIWDSFHPIESFAYHIAQGFLNGTYLTSPFNILGKFTSHATLRNS